jgi:head-tail adaptor
LDRRIDIERQGGGLDDYGQPLDGGWAKLIERRPAAYRVVNGDERFTADQFVAKQQVEFRIRYSQDVADLSPLDRIIYPASATPDESDVYDIMAVTELGRREGLSIMTARRAEVSNA